MSDLALIPGKTLTVDFGPVTRRDPYTGVSSDVDLRAGGVRVRFVVKHFSLDSDADALALLHFEAGTIETEGIVVPAVSGAPLVMLAGPPAKPEPWQSWQTEDGVRHVQLPSGTIYSADLAALPELVAAAETSDWHAQVAAAIVPDATPMGVGGVANKGTVVVGDDITRTWPARANLPWELELREAAAGPANERVTALDRGWIRTGWSILDTNP